MFSEDVLNIYNEQITNLSHLANLLRDFQISIKNNDINKLEPLVEKKEKSLFQISNCEQRRAEAIENALKHFQVDDTDEKSIDLFSLAVGYNNPELKRDFDESRINLSQKVKEVLLLNAQNEIIVNNARIFIKDFIKNILGSKKENFLDRKI